MYKNVFFATSFIFSYITLAQVGVGTSNPHASSILEIESSNKGFLPPRLTSLERFMISDPAEGLIVFCTNCCMSGTMSFFNGAKWTNLIDCSETDNDDDGIPNEIDIDDDNDGILDIDESLITTEDYSGQLNFDQDGGFSPVSGTLSNFTYPSSPASDGASISYSNVRRAFTSGVGVFAVRLFTNTQNGGNMGNVVINLNPENTNLSNSQVHGNSLVINDFNATTLRLILEIETSDGLITDVNDLELHVDFNSGETGTSTLLTYLGSGQFQLTITKGSTNPASLELITLGKLVTKYSLDFRQSDGFSGDQIAFPVAREIYTFTDSDGDNIPNQYDLDSDNDGCSDAREAGLTTSTASNFNYSNTDVGANGLSNSIENEDTQNGTTAAVTTTVYDGTCL